MSAMKDVLKAIDTSLGHLTEAQTSLAEAHSATAHGLHLAESVGLPASVEKLRRVKATTSSAGHEVAALLAQLERSRTVLQAMSELP